MKILFALLLAVGFGVSATHATSEVLSVNAVGYVKVDVPGPNKLVMASTPFVSLDGGEQTLGEIMGSEVPDETQVFVWSTVDSVYKSYTYYEGDGWLDSNSFEPAANAVVGRGNGFWLRMPAANSVFIMGQVPSDTDEVVSVVQGLTMIAFAYPVTISIDDANANINPIDEDMLFAWNAATQAYEAYTFYDGDGWLNSSTFEPAAITLEAGRGYWYRTTSTRAWTQTKPYLWP